MLDTSISVVFGGVFMWGNPVQKLSSVCGVWSEQIFSSEKCVHNQSLLHQFMNTFTMRLYTALRLISICYVGLIHTFHTPYNNHFFFKETNLYNNKGDNK